ncbi:MAG: hypothetical protein ACXV74_14170, partial [Methylobacter sp.]
MKENVAIARGVSLIALCLPAVGCAKCSSYFSWQWIDLSYDYSAETLYWPIAEPFKLDTVSAGMTEKGYYYSAYKFYAAEHGGAHIDAP